MKNKMLLVVISIMLLFTVACGSKDESSTTKADDKKTDQKETSDKQDDIKRPEGSIEIEKRVYFYNYYELNGDPGEGITPEQGASLLADEFLISNGAVESLEGNKCIFIYFVNVKTLDAMDGKECYIYEVELGSVDVDGTKSADSELLYVVAVDYSGKKASVVQESDLDEDSSGWNGTFKLYDYSIRISDYDGERFNYEIINTRSGEDILAGTSYVESSDYTIADSGELDLFLSYDHMKVEIRSYGETDWSSLDGEYSRVD